MIIDGCSKDHSNPRSADARANAQCPAERKILAILEVTGGPRGKNFWGILLRAILWDGSEILGGEIFGRGIFGGFRRARKSLGAKKFGGYFKKCAKNCARSAKNFRGMYFPKTLKIFARSA